MLKEFKEFMMRGNVIDLAVAVVIGAAFGKIVTSFVEDILMPPIGLALGGVDFSNLFINLSGKDYASVAAAKAAGAPTFNYGIFFNTILNFLIIAFAIFLIIKQMNRYRRNRRLAGAAAQPNVEPLGQRRYWPIYEAAEEAGLPVGVHAFGFGGNPITASGWPSYYIEEMVGHSQCQQTVLASLVLEGVFEPGTRNSR